MGDESGKTAITVRSGRILGLWGKVGSCKTEGRRKKMKLKKKSKQFQEAGVDLRSCHTEEIDQVSISSEVSRGGNGV